MKQTNTLQRTWWSAVGVTTAAATIVAGWAPLANAAPATPQRDNALRQTAAGAADGTYESCGAYFGFGKKEFDVLDIVAFDVTDQNGSDGASHSVGTDTQVVLELENESGVVMECAPVEVTEEMWNDELNSFPFTAIDVSADHPFPTWPGPGHYIYPTVNYRPNIDGFGFIASAGFKVTSVPTGHTLVSPTAVQPLAVHYPGAAETDTNIIDPLVLGYISETAGPAASAAFKGALETCSANGSEDGDFDADLIAAITSLADYLGLESYPEDMDCYDVTYLDGRVGFLLDFADTVNYREQIVLSVPQTPATVPPTKVTPPNAQQNTATPAKPVAVQPTYTG